MCKTMSALGNKLPQYTGGPVRLLAPVHSHDRHKIASKFWAKSSDDRDHLPGPVSLGKLLGFWDLFLVHQLLLLLLRRVLFSRHGPPDPELWVVRVFVYWASSKSLNTAPRRRRDYNHDVTIQHGHGSEFSRTLYRQFYKSVSTPWIELGL